MSLYESEMEARVDELEAECDALNAEVEALRTELARLTTLRPMSERPVGTLAICWQLSQGQLSHGQWEQKLPGSPFATHWTPLPEVKEKSE